MLHGISTILPLALALSADCFAVAVSCSVSIGSSSKAQVFRTAAAFGSFQALMPFLGWLAGSRVLRLISGYDHWLAFALLVFVGGRMLWESRQGQDCDGPRRDYNKVTTVIVLALATSLDALAVGFSLGFFEVGIGLSIAVIGAVAFSVTVCGFILGSRLGKLAGKRAEIAGGVILLAIGARILISHLTA